MADIVKVKVLFFMSDIVKVKVVFVMADVKIAIVIQHATKDIVDGIARTEGTIAFVIMAVFIEIHGEMTPLLYLAVCSRPSRR